MTKTPKPITLRAKKRVWDAKFVAAGAPVCPSPEGPLTCSGITVTRYDLGSEKERGRIELHGQLMRKPAYSGNRRSIAFRVYGYPEGKHDFVPEWLREIVLVLGYDGLWDPTTHIDPQESAGE